MTAVAGLPALLAGCSGVLDPAGPVGRAELLIMLNAVVVMLAIVVPVILATLAVAWWFRASNTRAKYRPDWEYSGRIELVVWSIPLMVVLALGGVGWIGAHDLDPKKPIPSASKPLEVQVVSLDWKWLFIYPEQRVAAVNQLVIPAGVPVRFHITSATVMNSFFVPRLGSQIYAMAGMVTQLHLQADQPGVYDGLSAQYSGAGFSRMGFKVTAAPPAQFASWVAATQASGPTLDAAEYTDLANPSVGDPPSAYRQVDDGLFEEIVRRSAPGAMATTKPSPAES